VKDWPIHLLLFLLAGAIVVVVSAMFAEPDDADMVKALPRRLLTFFLGCTAVIVVMLICEHTFASVR
jgi:cell division protein FtsW (lipid II flippase)